MRWSGSSEPGSGAAALTGHLAESAGLSTKGRGPRLRVRGGTESRRTAVLSAVVSARALSPGTLSLREVSGGATTGLGSQTLGFGGGGGGAGLELRASATGRGESPHPMVANMMTRRARRETDGRMRPAW